MNDQNQRLFLTIAMCLVVAWAWSLLFGPKAGAPGAKHETAIVGSATSSPPGQMGRDPALAGGSPARDPAATDVPRGTIEAAAPSFPSRKLSLRSEKLEVTIMSDGGQLEEVKLLGTKFFRPAEGKTPAGPLQLVIHAVSPAPLAASVRSLDGRVLIAENASYEVLESSDQVVVLRARAGGTELVRRVRLHPKNFEVEVSFDLRSDVATKAELWVSTIGHNDPNVSTGMFSQRADPAQAVCMSNGKLEKISNGSKLEQFSGSATAIFAGVSDQYFLSALLPRKGETAKCQLDAEVSGRLVARLASQVDLAPGVVTTRSFSLFAGPKDTEELAAVEPKLQDAVDFGFWAVIANVLLIVMKFFYKAVPPHNWGIAIILLTISVKAVTFPLQHKSMKSMQEMQRIQPLVEALKKKYEGDTQRFNQEQMNLFKEHGVNPMGGCLPIVIQMPVWFALYTTLRVSVELYNSMFIPGWLTDLTARDPYYILPAFMGVTMVLTQVLTPQPMSNPSQKMTSYLMTGFFTLMMLNLPSGLTLYIFVNNLLSIAQQVYLKRQFARSEPLVAKG